MATTITSPAATRACASSSRRAHSSDVPRTTGPQPRIPAATAPWSDPGSAAAEALEAYAIAAVLPAPDPSALHPRVIYANLRLGRVYTAQFEFLAVLQAQGAASAVVATLIADAGFGSDDARILDVGTGVAGLLGRERRGTGERRGEREGEGGRRGEGER